MIPKQLTRKSPTHESFVFSLHELPRFLNVWHYHEEVEIVFIEKSEGTKFIGDSITEFKEGDLVMIGSCLPHLWLNDKKYFEENDLEARSISIHFHPDCMGKGFFDIPEMESISQLLEHSKMGLEVTGKSKEKILGLLHSIPGQSEFPRLNSLLNILHLIAEGPLKKLLSSRAFMESYIKNSSSKLDMVYEYILNHFKDDISLETVAEVVKMHPSAFSRYFKRYTGKTFIQFLNDVRIGYACRTFIYNTEKNIAEVGFESGFNNISNFNRQFKKIMEKTPKDYIDSHRRHGLRR